jgi:hypothetical protein
MRSTCIAIALLSLSLAACNNPSSATSSATSSTDTSQSTSVGSGPGSATTAQGSSAAFSSLTPEQLGTLGAQIKKDPNSADALLSQHGLNAQSFAAAIRKVSENPADSKRYAAAFKSAS